METLARQAEQAAARVDSNAVGLAPITILAILTQVLPMIAACWNRDSTANAADPFENLRTFHEKNPGGLRRKVARRIRGEATEKMEKWQSLQLADGVIQQALSTRPEIVAACCAEAPPEEL